MNKIILLSYLSLFFALFINAVPRKDDSPFVQCGYKIDKLKTRVTTAIMNIARSECLKNPGAFNEEIFVRNNPAALCEQKIAQINMASAPQAMIEQARADCAKNSKNFDAQGYLRNFNYCDKISQTMTSLWKGFREKARRDCMAVHEPHKNFNEANFIKANVNPPR